MHDPLGLYTDDHPFTGSRYSGVRSQEMELPPSGQGKALNIAAEPARIVAGRTATESAPRSPEA